MHPVAIAEAEHLHLHMPSVADIAFQIDGRIAEGPLCQPLCGFYLGAQLRGRSYDSHANATTARGRLYQ